MAMTEDITNELEQKTQEAFEKAGEEKLVEKIGDVLGA